MTPLQKAFAELTGVLLARRWFEEQRRRAEQKATAPGEARKQDENNANDGKTRKFRR